MKKYLILTTLLSMFHQGVYSQWKEKKHKFEIHTTPITMVDFTPRLRIGVEYQKSDKFAYGLDFGLGNSLINIFRTNDSDLENDYLFWEVRSELKYYFMNSNNPVSLYCAAELFYLNSSSTIYDDHFYPETTSTAIVYDRAGFQKQKMGAHLKAGLKIVANNRFSLDFYFGGGIAYRTVNYTHVVNARTEEFVETNEEWGLGTKKEGNMSLFHVTLGFKVGYVF